MAEEAVLLRFRDKDSREGISRATMRKLAGALDLSETAPSTGRWSSSRSATFPNPRPALVTGIVEFEDGTKGVVVAYGTSPKTHELRSGEFLISPQDGEAYRASGLSHPTKFDLRSTTALPFTDEWFRVPPVPLFGQTPKLGILHPSLMQRATAAARAAKRN